MTRRGFPGGLLGRSWALLCALGALLCALEVLLGGLVASLGGFLAPLGPHLGFLALNLAIFIDFLTSRLRFSTIFLDFWCAPVSLSHKRDR